MSLSSTPNKVLLSIVLALALTACNDAKKNESSSVNLKDTGGSAKGDFGPPQGEPIQGVLTIA